MRVTPGLLVLALYVSTSTTLLGFGKTGMLISALFIGNQVLTYSQHITNGMTLNWSAGFRTMTFPTQRPQTAETSRCWSKRIGIDLLVLPIMTGTRSSYRRTSVKRALRSMRRVRRIRIGWSKMLSTTGTRQRMLQRMHTKM